MGFHAVVTGYLIKKHGSIEDYIRLVCKKITNKETGQEYKDEDMVNIIKDDMDGFFNFHELLDSYIVDFYDDIHYNTISGELIYKVNPIFKIGTICCNTMIYLCCVGDDMGGEEKSYTFKDEDILQLVEWKKQLVAHGRLSDTVIFASIPNCCS